MPLELAGIPLEEVTSAGGWLGKGAGCGVGRRLFGQDKLVVAGDAEPVFLLVMHQDDLAA